MIKKALFALLCFFSANSSAAVLLDLKNHNNNVLNSFVTGENARSNSPESLKELSRSTDVNHTTHVRVQEYYHNYPIWNAHAVIHIPEGKRSVANNTMNGHLYQNLAADLKNAEVVFTQAQVNRAMQTTIENYQRTVANQGDITITNKASQTLIFIDNQSRARWGYKITFEVPATAEKPLPAKPVIIIDAITFKIYKSWDDIKTAEVPRALVVCGGFGGNPNIGKLFYDGVSGHYPNFRVSRDVKGICYMENKAIKVTHAVTNEVMHFSCQKKNTKHNNIFWSGAFDAANQAYSPANDAMFAANVVKHMYKDWFGVPVLSHSNGTEMQLHMVVHIPYMDNAYWNGSSMNFGDGHGLYPLTSLGVSAHEVSHGFTEQHSNLAYEGESGGMNEAFSDMAAQAAEFYVYKRCSWQIGYEIHKVKEEAMRYMDMPSKDCQGKEPGTHCSIDRADQMYDGINVHYSSGVYNRAFYLLSTSENWDPRKAFHVMMHANAYYWMPQTQFADGAACVIKAAEDLHYDVSAIKNAFKEVGVNPDDQCTN